MEHLSVHPETPEKRLLKKITECLLNGGLVICPTGSGYSLVCHAGSQQALKTLTRIRRPKDPAKMTLVFKDFTSLSDYAQINNGTFKYMNPLVPGPYTFILPATHYTRKKLGLKRHELGVHFPYTKFIMSLFEYYPGPLLAKSLFSDSTDATFIPEKIDPNITSHVQLLADMGQVNINPSTIIDLTVSPPQLIRQGAGEVTQ